MNMQRRLFVSIMICVLWISFIGCDEAEQMVAPVIESLDDRASAERLVAGGYTGKLVRVGSIIKFGSGIHKPKALEWNGETLYMIASQGRFESERQFLCTVDRETGKASIVNPSAYNLGGSFGRGRGFTQVLGVRPNSMAWIPDQNAMVTLCPVLDTIVGIDLERGYATRGSWDEGFCIEGTDERVDAGFALGYDGKTLWMPVDRLYEFVEDTTRCVKLSNMPDVFHDGPGTVYPQSMSWDGENMYLSGSFRTNALHILDLQTGIPMEVGKWRYAELPPGVVITDKNIYKDVSDLTQMPEDRVDGSTYGYWNQTEGYVFDFPDVTGIAFDGQNMYAVCHFTDALYRLERR